MFKMAEFKSPIILIYLALLQCCYFKCAQAQAADRDEKVCLNLSESEKALKLQALHDQFPSDSDDSLNLVLLMDKSQSVVSRMEVMNMTVNFAENLFNYLIATRRMFIHPEYARIAIVSFGARDVVEFNGLADDRAWDACEATENIRTFLFRSQAEQDSNFTSGLENVRQILQQNRGNRNNNIVWLFYDADNDKEKTCPLCDQMREDGTVLFVAGIDGAWLDETEEETRLKSIAFDANHYACVSQWQEIIEETNVAQQKNDASLESDIYAASEDCELTCSADKLCACDVIKKSYSCQECGDIQGQQCDSMNSEEGDTGDSLMFGLDNTSSYIIIAIIILGGGLVIAFVIACVACICSCVRNRCYANPDLHREQSLSYLYSKEHSAMDNTYM